MKNKRQKLMKKFPWIIPKEKEQNIILKIIKKKI